MKQNLFAILGAAIGGAVGYFAFFWIARQGFYGLILPGGCLGMGASIFNARSRGIPIACGVLAVALGFYAEWRFAPFVANGGITYFVSHLHQLQPVTLIMIGLGGFIGFWAPNRRSQEGSPAAQ